MYPTVIYYMRTLIFLRLSVFFFFFNDTATTEIYTFPYTTLFRSSTQPSPHHPPARQQPSRHGRRRRADPRRDHPRRRPGGIRRGGPRREPPRRPARPRPTSLTLNAAPGAPAGQGTVLGRRVGVGRAGSPEPAGCATAFTQLTRVSRLPRAQEQIRDRSRAAAAVCQVSVDV